jgi:hypothetical protein
MANYGKKLRDKAKALDPSAVESIALRNEYSKTHYKSQNGYSLDNSVGPIHYKNDYTDNSEDWKEIDTKLEFVAGKYVVNTAPFSLEILSDKAGFKVTSKRGGWNEISLKDNPDLTKATVSDNEITFADAFTDVDIKVVVQRSRVTILKIIKSATAKRVFKYDIKESKTARRGGIPDFANAMDADNNYFDVEVTKTKTDETSEYIQYERVETIPAKVYRVPDDVLIDPVYPVWLDASVEDEVSAGADDTKIWGGSQWNNDHAFMITGYASGDPYECAWVHRDVNIAASASIDSGTKITVQGSGHSAGDLASDLYYEDANDPEPTTSYADFTGRTLSGTSITWDTSTAFSSGTDYDSPELETLIQALVDEAYWAANENIHIFWKDGAGADTRYRGIKTYESVSVDPCRPTFATYRIHGWRHYIYFYYHN